MIVQHGAPVSELHGRVPLGSGSQVPFTTVEQPICVQRSSEVKRLNQRRRIERGELPSEWRAFPVKFLPVRTAKYEVELREASLQAVHAMHTILSRMVLFICNHCKERFPAFHPAYAPPPSIASEM